MTGKITFPNLVRQLLPPHKRKPNRWMLLRALTSPLQTLFGRFNVWRNEIRMLINVNSQVKVFEGYLRKKYNEPVGIKIVTYHDGLTQVSLRGESIAHRIRTGLRMEGDQAALPLRGELRAQFADADFIVYIPPTFDPQTLDAIRAEIERFKQALVTYKIIQK